MAARSLQEITVITAFATLSWLALLGGVLYLGRHHLHHVVEVRVGEDGLVLAAPFLRRELKWSEIESFSPADDPNNAEHVLSTRDRDDFYLCCDLRDSEQLFKTIAERAPHALSTTPAHVVSDSLLDGVSVAYLVLCLAWSTAVINPSSMLSSRLTAEVLLCRAFLLFLVLAPLIYLWQLNRRKVAKLLQLQQSGVLLKTRSGCTRIGTEHIQEVRAFGPWVLLRSRAGWFVVWAEKNAKVRSWLSSMASAQK